MKIGLLGCGYVGQSIALQWKNHGHHVTATTRSKERVSQLKEFVDEVFVLEEHPLSSFIEQQEVLLIAIAPDPGSDYAATYLQTAKQVALACISHKLSKKANDMSCKIYCECARDHYQVDKVRAIHDEDCMTDRSNFSRICEKCGLITNHASSLRQIIYTSSTSLYGDRKGEWVDEEAVLIDQDENRKILHQTEQILLGCQSEHLDVCILRLGEIYGPGRKIEDRLKKMQHQSFAGTGESYTNLIHLEDIVNALDFALTHHLQGIYNLCSDFHIPRKQFYEQICKNEQLTPIQWDPSRHSPHGGNRRVSNQKIKNAGFTFTHPDYLI